MRSWELKVKATSEKIPHYGSGYTPDYSIHHFINSFQQIMLPSFSPF